MYRVDLEVLGAAFLQHSADGGNPDTLVEISVPQGTLSNAPGEQSSAPSTLVTQSTSLVFNSRQPKWGEKFAFSHCDKAVDVTLRLLERPADLKVPPRLLGEHVLRVGGLRRTVGCCWVALRKGVLDDESPAPIPDTPCLRVVWSLQRDLENLGGGEDAAAATEMNKGYIFTTQRVVPATLSSAKRSGAAADVLGTSGAVQSTSAPSGSDAAPAPLTEEWKQRIINLEERVDHLDNVFRTRRDYEAEVQRIMMEQASKAAGEKTRTSSGADEAAVAPYIATTPSAAVALLQSQQQKDLLHSCQPKAMSVGSTTSPWNVFQKNDTIVASAAAHFPLLTSKRQGTSDQSALKGILLQPTVVSAHDKQIAEGATYRPVPLPKPRLIGYTPAPFPPPSNPVRVALKASPVE